MLETECKCVVPSESKHGYVSLMQNLKLTQYRQLQKIQSFSTVRPLRQQSSLTRLSSNILKSSESIWNSLTAEELLLLSRNWQHRFELFSRAMIPYWFRSLSCLFTFSTCLAFWAPVSLWFRILSSIMILSFSWATEVWAGLFFYNSESALSLILLIPFRQRRHKYGTFLCSPGKGLSWHVFKLPHKNLQCQAEFYSWPFPATT